MKFGKYNVEADSNGYKVFALTKDKNDKEVQTDYTYYGDLGMALDNVRKRLKQDYFKDHKDASIQEITIAFRRINQEFDTYIRELGEKC